MPLLAIFVCVILTATLFLVWRRSRVMRRVEFIRQYALPKGLFERLQKRRPEMTLKDCQLASQGLRQFFLAYLRSGGQFVSMPSQVADDLWHEFILYTKNYDAFCKQAFGRFMHHTPAVVLGTAAQANAGLRRCWWHVCREENINPAKPTRLPLLFALDAKLGIADGFRYVADCKSVRRQTKGKDDGGVVYCGGDFSDAGFTGGSEGFGSDWGSDSSGGHGGHGDGGHGGDSGCGGGCGGGGCSGGGD